MQKLSIAKAIITTDKSDGKIRPISIRIKGGIYLFSIVSTFYIYKKLDYDDDLYNSLIDRLQAFYSLFDFLDLTEDIKDIDEIYVPPVDEVINVRPDVGDVGDVIYVPPVDEVINVRPDVGDLIYIAP